MNLVERLAKKFASAKHQNRFGAVYDNPIIQFETRWWLNAIVDELANNDDDGYEALAIEEAGGNLTNCGHRVADWLRAQAKENDDVQR